MFLYDFHINRLNKSLKKIFINFRLNRKDYKRKITNLIKNQYDDMCRSWPKDGAYYFTDWNKIRFEIIDFNFSILLYSNGNTVFFNPLGTPLGFSPGNI